MKLGYSLNVIEGLKNIELQTELAPDFGHGLQSQLPRIFEAVFRDLFLRAPDLDLPDLTLEYLKGPFISPAPLHQEVQEFVRIPVDLRQLSDGIQVFGNDLVGAFECDILDDCHIEFFLGLGDCPFRYPKKLSNLALGFTIPKHLI